MFGSLRKVSSERGTFSAIICHCSSIWICFKIKSSWFSKLMTLKQIKWNGKAAEKEEKSEDLPE